MNFIKLVISILLLVVLIAGIGIKSVLTIHYFVNKAEIIELFCINKEKPKLQCNGKCHLAQELKEVESNKEEQPYLPSVTNLNLELIFITQNEKLALQHFSTRHLKNNTPYLKKITSTFQVIITPPPQQFV